MHVTGGEPTLRWATHDRLVASSTPTGLTTPAAIARYPLINALSSRRSSSDEMLRSIRAANRSRRSDRPRFSASESVSSGATARRGSMKSRKPVSIPPPTASRRAVEKHRPNRNNGGGDGSDGSRLERRRTRVEVQVARCPCMSAGYRRIPHGSEQLGRSLP